MTLPEMERGVTFRVGAPGPRPPLLEGGVDRKEADGCIFQIRYVDDG